MHGAPLSNRLRWKEVCTFVRVINIMIHANFNSNNYVTGFGFCEGPNLDFCHRMMTWNLQQCLALPRWHMMYLVVVHQM
jgi:hypothetical protein